MDITDYVKEFRSLQKTQKVRVADFCRERLIDYYAMVEALKRDKLTSDAESDRMSMGDLELTDLPLDSPSLDSSSFIRDVALQAPSGIKVRIHGITATDLITVLGHLIQIKPC